MVSLQGYKLFRSDRTSRHGGGVAVYVKNCITCKIKCKSNEEDLIEYLFLEIAGNNDKLLFGSIYRPRRNININPLIDQIEEISLSFEKIILAGDFNSNILDDTVLTQNMRSIGLESVNLVTPTHFTPTSSSLLDLFFVSYECTHTFYSQISAPCFSKHDLIYMVCDLTLSITSPTASITYRDFSGIDYDVLRDEFDKIDWNMTYYLLSIDDQLAFLEDNINSLFAI